MNPGAALRLVTAFTSVAANIPLGVRLATGLVVRPAGVQVSSLAIAFAAGPALAALSSALVARGGRRAAAWHLVALGASLLVNLLWAPLLDGGVGELAWTLLAIMLLATSVLLTLLLVRRSAGSAK